MKFEVVSSNTTEKEKVDVIFEQRILDVLGRTRASMVSRLLQEHPVLDQQKLLTYLDDYSDEYFEKVKNWFQSAVLQMVEYVSPQDYLFALEFENENLSEDDTKIISDYDALFKDLENQYGISFGPHEDLFIREEIASMRLDLLRESLSRSFEAVVKVKRQKIAQYLAQAYIHHGRKVPNKLRLLLSAEEFSALERSSENGNDPVELPESLNDMIQKNKDLLVSKKEKMIKEGVHPIIAEKKMNVALDQSDALSRDTLERLEESYACQIDQVASIIQDNDDPRDVYEWITDANQAIEIYNQARSRA